MTTPDEQVVLARFDLPEEVRMMRSTPRTANHVAKTLLRTADLRIVLMVLERGATISEHRAEGRMTIQGLDGVVQLRTGDSILEVGAGCLFALDRNVPHAIEAVEASSILLTIAWRGHVTP